MAGFRPVGTISGRQIDSQDLLFKDTETLTLGDILNLETGEVDLGVTGDNNFIGVALETVSGTDSTTRIRVTTNPDIILSVEDNNARLAGAPLDLTGATGAQGVGASTNANFRVYAESTASEPTLVIFNPKLNAFAKEV